MTGLLGEGGAVIALAECDLLLLLGTDFPFRHFMPTDTKIVQIDIAPAGRPRSPPSASSGTSSAR